MDTSALTDYFNLSELPEDERKKTLEEIQSTVSEAVMAKLLTVLPQEKQLAFIETMKTTDETDSAWMEFLKQELPDYEETIKVTIEETLQKIKLGI